MIEKVNEIVTVCRKDKHFRVGMMMYINFSINFAYAVFEAFCGYILHSSWMGTLAFYYIILSVMRFLLIKGHKNGTLLHQWKIYRICGIVIIMLAIVLLIIHILTIHKIYTILYREYMIYAIAIYTFYIVYSAIRNVIVYRKINEPILLANKVLNLAIAIISIYNLQSAMITAFGNDEAFRITMGNCVAIGALVVIVWISVTMIVKATNTIKKLSIKQK